MPGNAVRQRTAEIGVRMALGASRGAVLGMILSYGAKLSTTGLVIGLCLAFALTRSMASFLYGVNAADLKTFVVVPAFTIFVAFVACVAPAWRAARIDPLVALRHQ